MPRKPVKSSRPAAKTIFKRGPRGTTKGHVSRAIRDERPRGQQTDRRSRGATPMPQRRPAGARAVEVSPKARPTAKDEPLSDVIEGRNPVLEALHARRPITKILMAEGVGRHSVIASILGLAKESGILVEYVDRRAVERLSSSRRSQGVVALAAVKAYATQQDILETARRRHEQPLLVVLDRIQDPENLGGILRTAEAAGAHGVIIPERRAVGLTAAVGRVSAGAIEYIAVARVGNLAAAMERLAQEPVWFVGVDPQGPTLYTDVDYCRPTAIVVGAEGRGLSPTVKSRCDALVSIPMRGKIASLNASVAAGLVLYEAMRQRDAARRLDVTKETSAPSDR